MTDYKHFILKTSWKKATAVSEGKCVHRENLAFFLKKKKKKGTHTSLILFCFLCFSSSTLKFHREVKQTNKMALLNQQ